MQTKTAWQHIQLPEFPKLRFNEEFDVVVIGGGITGLTAAYLLKRAGKTVCLLERGRLTQGDTGCTTAHLTCVTDIRPSELVRTFGVDAAQLVWGGGAAAVNTIEGITIAEGIDCEFRRVPGFLHGALKSETDERPQLEADVRAAREMGFEAMFLQTVPGLYRPGVSFADQAKFHPLKYLAGVAQAFDGDGCAICEESEVTEVTERPLAVKVNGKEVRCEHLVVATHVPLMGKAGFLRATLLQTKLAAYSTYAIGAKIPRDLLPAASFWDTSDPYYYLRVDRGDLHDYAIFGGEDHKTGQADDTPQRFARLESLFKSIVPAAEVDRRWSGQVIETNDGLPYIGEDADRQFVATGFSGNGMTFGTLSGMMACDWVLKRHNPWQDLFSVNRTTILGGVWDYIREGLDYPYFLVRDRISPPESVPVGALQRGEGRILMLNGEQVACYRDEQDHLSQVSPVCTHLGCIVHWNAAEHTWDCPCHGSRFRPTGEVLAGPAESPLEPVSPPVVQHV